MAAESGVAPMLLEGVNSIATRQGERHWRVGEARLWLARALLADKDVDRGREEARSAFDVLGAALGNDDPMTQQARDLVELSEGT